MKFEKLNENKIRITLTVQDLAEKEIDFHVFMSNSIESQSIFLDMLEEAKKETGFDPEDCNLKVEALALADTDFIFTITKMMPEQEKENVKAPKRKFSVKRKTLNPSSTKAIYAFNSFEDFCGFLRFLNRDNLLKYVNKLAGKIHFYSYKNKYFLLLENIHPEVAKEMRLYSSITEFARCVSNSAIFASKLKECGNLIMKHNALIIGLKHFAS